MTATTHTTATVRPKEFHFPLSVEWLGERRVVARVEGKPAIETATPPVFAGSDPATWSPEERTCLVSASLDLPVETVIEMRRPAES